MNILKAFETPSTYLVRKTKIYIYSWNNFSSYFYDILFDGEIYGAGAFYSVKLLHYYFFIIYCRVKVNGVKINCRYYFKYYPICYRANVYRDSNISPLAILKATKNGNDEILIKLKLTLLLLC